MKKINLKGIIKEFRQIPERVIAVAVIICILFVAIGYKAATVGVFNPERHLPIYSVEANKVAITFDCAWGSEDIPTIMDVLKKENVKATFFIVGQWAEKFPDAVRLMAKEGHDVANHGYSHLRMSTISKEKCRSEIELCNQKLEEISGVKVKLFRPPYGDYNNTVVDTCNELSCYPIQWNVDTLNI